MSRNLVMVVGAAAIASATTWVVTARALGIPNSADTPSLVYSGVLLENGAPVTREVEIEVGIWDDQERGPPDNVLCTTGENVNRTPDASGAFSIALPSTRGTVGQDCTFAVGDRSQVYVQVEVNKEVVSYTFNGKTVDRVPLAAVPYAIDANRAVFASGGADGPDDLTIEQRLQALEAAVLEGGGQ